MGAVSIQSPKMKSIDKGLYPINQLLLSVVACQKTLEFKKNPITDDYILLSTVLGLGVNGKVRQVVPKNTPGSDKCALKILKDNAKSRKEIELHWNSSTCEHIVNIKDVYENVLNGENYLMVVMECMEGGELFNRLQEQKYNEKG